jgi:nucleoside-diphosphate-sugar epimerase
MLIGAGHDIVGLDVDLYQSCVFGPEPTPVPTCVRDVRDVEESDLEGFDAVLHLAGLSNDPLGDLDPEVTDAINHKGTLRVARAAKAVGVKRFVFASSCSNYGAGGSELLDEESELRPVTPYALSKVRSEEGLKALADDDFSPVYLRASTAYGFSPHLRFDLVVNNLTAWAFTTKRVHLKSDGSAWRPLVHVEDIARAYLAVLEAPCQVVHDQAFNVGATSENYTVREVAEAVRDVIEGSQLEFAANAGTDSRCYKVDCGKIARVLPESRPRWTVRRGVEELRDAYSRFGLGAEEYEGPRYQRLAHVRKLVSEGLLTPSLRWKAPCGCEQTA